MTTITISGLSKNYNGFTALHGVNLEIGSGLFGLLGPNGAGKTTLMRILVTLLEPTQGSIQFCGYDIRKNRAEIRRLIGYLPQELSTFPRLKTWEFLDYSARLAGIGNKRERRRMIENLLGVVGIYDARNRQTNKLSGGMKRRLGIAQALLGNPKVIVIDEPTTGLDPEERLRFQNLLAEMSRSDIIIVLSTHIVVDISSSCSQLAVLNKGRLIFCGSPDELIEHSRGHAWLLTTNDSELQLIKDRYTVISSIPCENGYNVQVVGDKIEGFEAELIEPSLEHAYIYFMEQSVLKTDPPLAEKIGHYHY